MASKLDEQLKLAQKHLAKNDKYLASVIKQHGPCQIKPHTDHYGQLARSIVGQQCCVKAAQTIFLRFQAEFGGKTPRPEQLITTDDEVLRGLGLSYAKASYVKDLAARVLDKRLDLAHIATMPNDQLIEQLTAVKGIGEWSAHMFMIFGLGRLDVLPVGDLGVRKAMMQLYDLKALPDPATCVTIANNGKWHPYESVAAWYLWRSLDNS